MRDLKVQGLLLWASIERRSGRLYMFIYIKKRRCAISSLHYCNTNNIVFDKIKLLVHSREGSEIEWWIELSYWAVWVECCMAMSS